MARFDRFCYNLDLKRMIFMSLSIGIVGLPNAGKSTLFQALTRKQVLIANYPFATIEPNHGVVPVPDERIDVLAKMSASKKVVPTTVEFVDIAGLVRGASKGEGLGNAFLGHIREVDAIVHVVRGFTDANVTHVHGKVDPKDDIEVIELELILADKASVEKRLATITGKVKAGVAGKAVEEYAALLKRLLDSFNKGIPARKVSMTDDEKLLLKDLSLLTIKPVLYVFNGDEEGLTRPGLVTTQQGQALSINAKIEAELAELSEEDAKAYMKELGMAQSGLDKLIKAGYALLDLMTFLTTGPDETRAWTVHVGTRAPQAAGVIHTDFEKNFIRVEVASYTDYVQYGGEAALKQKGLWRTEGKEYILQDGDVCYFRVGV